MYIKQTHSRFIIAIIDMIFMFIFGIFLHFTTGVGTLDTTNGWNLSFENFDSIILLVSFYTLLGALTNGASIGRILFKQQVVTVDGQELTKGKAILRGFLKGLLYWGSLISIITMYASKNKQSLHDMITKTVVVKKSNNTDYMHIEN